jgi:Na+/phosphate symporter
LAESGDLLGPNRQVKRKEKVNNKERSEHRRSKGRKREENVNVKTGLCYISFIHTIHKFDSKKERFFFLAGW